MSEKLRPCPFCGGEAKIFADQGGGICVKCMKCYCQTDNRCDFSYDDCMRTNAFNSIVEMWNRRTNDDQRG